MTYKPLSEYGVIGDMHSAALVGSNGSIDWLCFPRFDSPSVFAAILDHDKGGRFQIAPLGPYEHDQSYLPGSNVLVTTFRTKEGVVSLTDFMPIGDNVAVSDHEVLRLVRCQSGRADLEVVFQPRLDYARGATRVKVSGGGAIARQGNDRLTLVSDVPLAASDGAVQGRFALQEGQWAAFLLRWQGADAPVPPTISQYDTYGKLGKTQAFWRFVADDGRYQGRWEALVKRSLLALHLLLYVPTGAVCAAVTTSLPEAIGGQRNWDYRYCWLRDAAFTMDIFNRLGHTTYTQPFINWLARLAMGNGEDVHSLYGIGHEADPHAMDEVTLDHLEGYKGARPVRIGNAAFHQLQLDVYGEVLLSFDSYQRAGGVITEPLWALAESLVEGAIRHWQKPDNGIWEVRGEPRHFTYSKLMCWVAVDRGLRLARALQRPVDFDRWRKARAAMREEILGKAWNARRGAFVQAYGAKNLDASVLFLPMVGFLPGDDPRILSTVRKIQQELAVDGLVYRYRPEETEDGVGGPEGTFTMCSLWLAGCLLACGDLERATHVFERVVGLSNNVGLYSEMIDPRNDEFLGNYPQAFTHIALIHTARNLDRALSRVEPGKVVAV